MSDKKIIAITIGPIYDTMQLVSKPAGLWGASYLFSYISRRLTEKLDGGNVIAPYFKPEKADEDLMKKGVGYYHDHILIRGASLEKATLAIEDVKEEVAKEVFKSLSAVKNVDEQEIVKYIKAYLTIYLVEVQEQSGENAINATAKYLDAIELQRGVTSVERENYLAEFLENEVIRNSSLVPDRASWMLTFNNDRIKDLPTIAKSDRNDHTVEKDYKRYSYYVLVSADGDRMGKIIANMTDDDAIREFSQKSMKFTTCACEKIIEFGGVVVYAGGDDLQFIAPLTHFVNGKEKTIFSLIGELAADFKTSFREATLSFGVAISYIKYPLYETLNKSIELLHLAKESGRDAAMIRLQKHSGQTSELLIQKISERFKDLDNAMDDILQYQLSSKLDPLKSVIAHISQMPSLFNEVFNHDNRDELLNNYIMNMFDNPGQANWIEYLEKVKRLMILSDLYRGNPRSENSFRTEAVISMMRIIQFFGECGKEEEDE